jgi:hypothetical protein
LLGALQKVSRGRRFTKKVVNESGFAYPGGYVGAHSIEDPRHGYVALLHRCKIGHAKLCHSNTSPVNNHHCEHHRQVENGRKQNMARASDGSLAS